MGRTQEFNENKKVKALQHPSYTNKAVDTGSELGLEEELIYHAISTCGLRQKQISKLPLIPCP